MELKLRHKALVGTGNALSPVRFGLVLVSMDLGCLFRFANYWLAGSSRL